jgi:hypothetical protein
MTKLRELKGDRDVMEEIPMLNLPPKEALATYLKHQYKPYLPGMTDEDWLEEAADLLEMLGVKEQ